MCLLLPDGLLNLFLTGPGIVLKTGIRAISKWTVGGETRWREDRDSVVAGRLVKMAWPCEGGTGCMVLEGRRYRTTRAGPISGAGGIVDGWSGRMAGKYAPVAEVLYCPLSP